MPTCSLIVTGKLEARALPGFLAARFPGLDVGVVAQPNGATTTRLHRGKVHQPVTELARTLVRYALGDRRGQRPDLLLVVDDLELHNQDQPDVVVEALRAAVDAAIHAQALDAKPEARLRAWLSEHASFHLLDPMPESYFFDAPTSLTACGVAGVPSGALGPVYGSIAWNAEDFEVYDPSWVKAVAGANAVHALAGRGYWREQRHPKRYLEHLLGASTYTEGVLGVEAFGALPPAQWPRVGTCPLLSALLSDVAHALTQLSPTPHNPTTHTWPPPRDRVLRNV